MTSWVFHDRAESLGRYYSAAEALHTTLFPVSDYFAKDILNLDVTPRIQSVAGTTLSQTTTLTRRYDDAGFRHQSYWERSWLFKRETPGLHFLRAAVA